MFVTAVQQLETDAFFWGGVVLLLAAFGSISGSSCFEN
jgi:hypothetical protein